MCWKCFQGWCDQASRAPPTIEIWCLRWAWLDYVYRNTVIHLRRIMVTLFIWIIPSMVLHLKWMVYWISIVVIHMFMPKDSNDSTTYLWHCHVSHIGIKRMKKLHVDGSFGLTRFLKSLRHVNHVYWYVRMKKLHVDGSFGLIWFWITWDMQIIPHGQDDWKPRFQ